jgi:hypothetical protein
MWTSFDDDGKVSYDAIHKALMLQIANSQRYVAPSWVVPGTAQPKQSLLGGYNIIEYTGPAPKVVKL